MFNPHYGQCSLCEKDDQLLVVKKLLCAPCNHKLKEAKKKKEGKKTDGWTYIRKPTGEKDVFEAVLDNLEDIETRCFICNIRVALVTHVNMAHVIAKGKYPKMRLNPNNIRILCTQHHYDWDFKPRSELKDETWTKMFELELELKEEYKNLENG